MPKEYPTKFKTEVIQRYRNGESIQLLSQTLRKARFITGGKSIAPSKQQIAPIHQKNLMSFQGGW
mgnify:CR=1 FL=1